MKGYKGFAPGLVCRGKQYQENMVFVEENAEICKKGMHFCENPFYVLEYYGFVNDNAELNEFAEVEALDEVKTDDHKKYCTKKLKVGAKLSFAGFVKACVDFVIEKTTISKEELKKMSEVSIIPDSGNDAQIGSSGYAAKIGSSGDAAQIGSSGKNCVICCASNNSMAKAKIGSWITLSEWKRIDNEYVPVCVRTEKVDGERIKEDVFYCLKNGEFVEAQND